ncbi:MAG: hypothetical protein JKY96_08350 [Phycisphaerales bacterium]|nr:hypothetical protein [Phycisphaerales bacterium]
MTPKMPKAATPICPKCGYDQSGIIDSWTDRCPVEGRCAECGLDFAWADVLDPSRVDLPWYIEHARSKREMMRRTIPTLWMLLIPNRYWKRVGVESRIQMRVLLAWCVVLNAVLYLVTSAVHLFAMFELGRYWATPIATLQQNKMVAHWQFFAQTDMKYWSKEVLGSLLYPFIDVNGLGGELSEAWLGFSFIAIGVPLMWLVILSVVPTTRRLARLRIKHVFRATVVSIGFAFLGIQILRSADAIGLLEGLWVGSCNMKGSINTVSVTLGLLMVVWVYWFWISAIRVGWQVRPSWLLILLGSIATLLGGPMIGGLIGVAFEAMAQLIELLAY